MDGNGSPSEAVVEVPVVVVVVVGVGTLSAGWDAWLSDDEGALNGWERDTDLTELAATANGFK